MATDSTVNEKQKRRKEKDEKQSPTNHGCSCCKFCKVITSEIEPVNLSMNVININPICACLGV